MPSLTFLGAARTVTGSKYLLDTGEHRVLIDSGLFQGLKELRERNWHPLPVRAETIDAVILTHAHIDHCGYLPRLVKEGFRGRIICTPGTGDLARIVLPDAGRLQEEDARQANKHRYSRHEPALPLFTEEDAFRAVSQLHFVGYHKRINVTPGLDVEFQNAGHLLGSAYARVSIASTAGGNAAAALEILFGGDLGRYDRPVLPDPSPVTSADVLLIESTYGNRVHEADDDGERLARIVRSTAGRGGKVIIPAFAIGRVEEVLYWLKRLEDANRIPELPVFVDSPMAVDALKHYATRLNELDPDVRPAGKTTSAFATKRFQAVSSPQHSKEVTASRVPSIVISSSGMATGGRVLHHLKAALPDPRHTVLFVGYQAAGTRGRSLVDGAPAVRIHGMEIPVHAHVEKIDSMSAHADSLEMLRWLGGFTEAPRVTHLVHGEPEPMDALKAAIQTKLSWNVHTPEYLEPVDL
jgi:metallo-beta-lactamase family protein